MDKELMNEKPDNIKVSELIEEYNSIKDFVSFLESSIITEEGDTDE